MEDSLKFKNRRDFKSALAGFYAVYTDHTSTMLSTGSGSILKLTDENSNVVAEQCFDACSVKVSMGKSSQTIDLLEQIPSKREGLRRDPADWDYSGTPTPPVWLHRGYTGHEHLDEFDLIHMPACRSLSIGRNGRMYDPKLGRMISADNYVQAPNNTQSYNRYSYVLNNPLKYTDPSGEIIAFRERRYERIQKWSPIAIKINVDVIGEQGVGYDISYGRPTRRMVSHRKHQGSTYYWNNQNGESGWEHREGEETSYLFGRWSLSGTTYSGDLYNGESQTTNTLTRNGRFLRLSYENDQMFGADQVFIGVRAADGGDRYRTAAMQIGFGRFVAGFTLITGDPGPEGMRDTDTEDGTEIYSTSIFGDDPDQYRLGKFYIGSESLQLTRDSEQIRHAIQNRFAHDIGLPLIGQERSPHFRVLERDSSWGISIGTGSGNSLY